MFSGKTSTGYYSNHCCSSKDRSIFKLFAGIFFPRTTQQKIFLPSMSGV